MTSSDNDSNKRLFG